VDALIKELASRQQLCELKEALAVGSIHLGIFLQLGESYLLLFGLWVCLTHRNLYF
jgi:hypothetical protein